MSRHIRPGWIHGGIALACSAAVMLALQFGLGLPWEWPWLLAGWLLGTTLTAFLYYGYDKAQARGEGRRVPEVVLHGVALAGGTLGAYAGMRVFRHKTIKGPFLIVFWTVSALQAALLAAIAWRLVKG